MTQSGQGEEPSARPAREGIVLPSDGGEPLLPGMTGGSGDRPSGQYPPAPPAPAPPAGGQAWDRPWGPDQHQGPPAGQSWPTPPDQQWGSPEASPAAWSSQGQAQPADGPGALPPEGAHPPAYGAQPSYAPNGHPSAPQRPTTPDGYGAPAPSAPLPPAGTGAYGPPPTGAPSAPLPPSGAEPYGRPTSGAPMPPADEGATQYLPPVAAPVDEGATQYIPPVGPGALPPERPAGTPSEETRFLGRVPQGGPRPGSAPQPGAGPLPPASHPDAEATQYIAPVAGQPAGAPYGQPPAGFENLFRSEGGDGSAGATQQLPVMEHPQAAQPPYAPQGPGGGGRGGRGGRTGSRLPLIAAVGVGIAVLGVGAGALLAGGGGDDQDAGNQTVSATAPATEGSASPSADPARQQAVELDKLLADSGDSRSTVINAVADVKRCDNLAQAAKDLRDAARQRTDLVTRLSGLTVDRLPNHAALTTALTKAWQASASADNHYAAWADQVAGKKGCRKGQARTTAQTQAGNRASGTASVEKTEAAKLWNAIAKTYGLTERRPTQL
ncbi:hypothetical protein [Streptomyces sp. S.PNR 29]|uniref:hypothetical protein n=1 Tax=Streptomyces sp. S.PNR 29 TaxID=2973805 RepID=UPI0025B225F7|nr:hypothetical protein [Streptomyces sp. S.PNR 29]MDN0194085.1 hypothetical protein [Streptomyces sp. S.PNR 29]